MNEIGALLFAAKVYPTAHTTIVYTSVICYNEKNAFFVEMVGHYTSPSNFSTAQHIFLVFFQPYRLYSMG